MADELPTAPPVEEPTPRRVGTGFWIGFFVFLVIGCAVSFFLLLPLGMSSDPCGQGDPEFRCSLTGQELLPWLPWLALVAGLIVAGIGASLVRRWEAAPATGLFSAGVIYVVTLCIALGYAGGGDGPQAQPPSDQAIAAEYHQLQQRPDSDTMLSRYEGVVMGLQNQLDPSIQWQPMQRKGPYGCDTGFPAMASTYTEDAQQWEVSTYISYAPDAQNWPRNITALTTYLTQHAFTPVPGLPDPINGSPAEATFRDQYGAVVAIHTKDLVSIAIGGGCFLSKAAKARNTPPTTGP